MGCCCDKRKINDFYLDISQENKNNLKPEVDLLLNKDKFDTLDTRNQESLFESKIDLDSKAESFRKNQYNQRVFELINKVRLNPAEYSKTILDNVKNIKIERHEEMNKLNGIKEFKEFFVFKKKVKVKLFRGEECFLEAAKYLVNTPPMEILKFNKDIVIPLPNTEQEMKNSEFIKNKVNEILLHNNINAYFKEYIKNPEIAVLLMIVDDTQQCNFKKRKSILNQNYKYMGIDSKFIGKNFVAHFSFSK